MGPLFSLMAALPLFGAAAVLKPAAVAVDFAVDCGRIKPMNAVNNGPVSQDGSSKHTNFDAYRAALIPFARTHAASEYIVYGGDHTVDISAVFPRFDADENDPASYDFAITDSYLRRIINAGAEVFFRLGQRNEHGAKRYNVWPPKDFAKWARICEHVIRHYNEGWADGFRWNIRYWEIWNEPDLVLDREENSARPRTWGGTPEQFFAFYETAAKHLKGKFPALRIGGPAVAHAAGRWSEGFLKYQRRHDTPIDFFSWCIYTHEPEKMSETATAVRGMMKRHGYGGSESIVSGWNYVKGGDDSYMQTLGRLASRKGAAFAAAAMIACQSAPVDMMMYFDARPDAHFNGVFDKTTLAPLPPYYAFYSWGGLSTYKSAVRAATDAKDVFAFAARHDDGRRAIFVVRHATDDNVTAARTVTVRISGDAFPAEVAAHVTDDTRMHTEIPLWPASQSELAIRMQPDSFVLIEYRAESAKGKEAAR